MQVPKDLPRPHSVLPKFQRCIDESKFPDRAVVMNYDTGNMHLVRPAVAAQSCRPKSHTYKGEKIEAPATWFQLTLAETEELYPLWCNYQYFNMMAFNLLSKAHEDNGLVVLPDHIKSQDDLMFEPDAGKRRAYSKALNNRKTASGYLTQAKENRRLADRYARPSTIAPDDFASRDFYGKSEVGFLTRYANERRTQRDENAIMNKEEVAVSEELIKEKAREIAREKVKKKKKPGPKPKQVEENVEA